MYRRPVPVGPQNHIHKASAKSSVQSGTGIRGKIVLSPVFELIPFQTMKVTLVHCGPVSV
jgi:hypothetical protein